MTQVRGSITASKIIKIQLFCFVHLQSISNEPEKHFAIPIVFYFYAIFITFLYEEKAQVFLSLTMKFEIENQFTQTATMFAFANISLKRKKG